MNDPFFEKIRSEISDTQKRRQRTDLLKITFVSALLGFGTIKTADLKELYLVLYIAPLVAVFLDLLTMGEHFSIRRMGAFLRLSSESEKEREYEAYVSRNLDKFFIRGSQGFTVLSFIGAIFLLANINDEIRWWEILWFLLLFSFFVILTCLGRSRLKRFSILKSTSGSIYD